MDPRSEDAPAEFDTWSPARQAASSTAAGVPVSSMASLGKRRSSHLGIAQVRRPSSSSTDGSSRLRITNASRKTALARLRPAHRKDMDAWARQRLEPLRRALERMSPRARAQFMEGWRILAEETASTEPGDEVDCDD
jgi:hypothetical protein